MDPVMKRVRDRAVAGDRRAIWTLASCAAEREPCLKIGRVKTAYLGSDSHGQTRVLKVLVEVEGESWHHVAGDAPMKNFLTSAGLSEDYNDDANVEGLVGKEAVLRITAPSSADLWCVLPGGAP